MVRVRFYVYAVLVNSKLPDAVFSEYVTHRRTEGRRRAATNGAVERRTPLCRSVNEDGKLAVLSGGGSEAALGR